MRAVDYIWSILITAVITMTVVAVVLWTVGHSLRGPVEVVSPPVIEEVIIDGVTQATCIRTVEGVYIDCWPGALYPARD